MSLTATGTDLQKLLHASYLEDTAPGMSSVHLLRHFHTVTSLTLGSSAVQAVMHNNVAAIAWSQPYLMHVLLAVASIHLKRLISYETQAQLSRDLTTAERQHWQAGLELYREELDIAAQRPSSNGDALISTIFLTVIYAFALSEVNGPEAYLEDYNEAIERASTPMMAGSGIKALQSALNVFDSSVAWKPVLMAGDDSLNSFTLSKPGCAGIPGALVDLCEVHDESTSENNKYHSILRHLSPLLELKPAPVDFVKVIAFGGRTAKCFRPLLASRDHRALLLMSMWFALLQQIDQWWLKERASAECLALSTYLAVNGDAKIQALLAHGLRGT